MPEVSAPGQMLPSSHSASLLGVSAELGENILTPIYSGGIIGIPWLANAVEPDVSLPPQLQFLIDNFLLQGIDRVDATLKLPLELIDRAIDSLNLRVLGHPQSTAFIPFDNDLFRGTADATKHSKSAQSNGPVLDLYELEIPKLPGDLNLSSSAAIRSESGPELSVSNSRNQPPFTSNLTTLPTPTHLLPERSSQRAMPLEQTPRPYDEPRKRKFRRKAESSPKQSFKETLQKLIKQSTAALTQLGAFVNGLLASR
jgi:hypothetical protein